MSGFFQHPQALVESTSIGDGTRVWAFAHVLPHAVIGRDCNICDHVFIENDVIVGDRVTIKSGVQLWDGARLEDDVFIGPNVTFTNDAFPRSKQYQAQVAHIVVKRGASIGGNATLLPGIVIGEHAMIGAGAIVSRDVPPNGIVRGVAARLSGFVGDARADVLVPAAETHALRTAVRGVQVKRLPAKVDARGSLSFAEHGAELPFVVQRYFLIYDVKAGASRGTHAHRALQQFMICIAGSCTLLLDDGTTRESIVLDDPTLGVHVPPMTWVTQYHASPDAALLVLASDAHDEADYIRDYAEFRTMVAGP
ncbi:MAG: isomerase [Gemmatimonadetes bacterium]|nr:isomerase [Gemmatimonadota bacterium]